MKAQRIFISGVAGFLGSHVAELLVRQGHSVCGADDMSCGDEANIPNHIDFFEYDVRDFNANIKALKKVDVVFHAAAYAHDGLSVFAPHQITENILSTSTSLISAAIQSNVKRFVYCSSMSRYGTQDIPMFTEEMTPKPQTPYGLAKLACEDFLRNLADTHGMEWTVCVPHNIIGPRQRYDDPYRNVVAIMINRMLQGQPPIIYGDGLQKRCFSPIQDVLEIIPKLLFDPLCKSQVFNVGPDHEFITIKDLAQIITSEFGQSFDPIHIEQRPNEVLEANCSSQKARQLLGYTGKTDMRASIREMIKSIEKRGPRPFNYKFDIEIKNHKTPATWKERIL